MANRVTIQDIADALGISRNTVSKAINNSAGIADATREKILKKAAEMGYKQFSYINQMTNQFSQAAPAPREHIIAPAAPAQQDAYEDTYYNVASSVVSAPAQVKEIALFTEGFLGSSHFSHAMLDKFQREISQLGYSLSMHHLTSDEIDSLQLPLTFSRERTSGIVCVEVFSNEYARMLCELGIPLLFVDAPVEIGADPLPTDMLIMDNFSGIYRFVQDMLAKGVKEIGFIGHSEHCRSFFDRYMAFRIAMFLFGGKVQEEFYITDNCCDARYPAAGESQRHIKKKMSKLDHLPEVFICANDFIALEVIAICKEMGIHIPQDLQLCGFDDSPESRIVSPPLTTIHIHSRTMGSSAVALLMSRIKDPDQNYRTVYTETKLIYRESAPKN